MEEIIKVIQEGTTDEVLKLFTKENVTMVQKYLKDERTKEALANAFEKIKEIKDATDNEKP